MRGQDQNTLLEAAIPKNLRASTICIGPFLYVRCFLLLPEPVYLPYFSKILGKESRLTRNNA
jgi:hypothetical protein